MENTCTKCEFYLKTCYCEKTGHHIGNGYAAECHAKKCEDYKVK
jgi:hypothetical protein